VPRSRSHSQVRSCGHSGQADGAALRAGAGRSTAVGRGVLGSPTGAGVAPTAPPEYMWRTTMARQTPTPPAAVEHLPVVFQANTHTLTLRMLRVGCWTVAVDQLPPEGTYASQVDAWEAGVRQADQLK